MSRTIGTARTARQSSSFVAISHSRTMPQTFHRRGVAAACTMIRSMRTIETLPLAAQLAQASMEGRVVLITGASGGIGKALSLACARAGATVVLHGRVVRKLEALYDEIMAAKLPEPTILPLDFARAEASDCANVAHALDAQLGRLDALVHTAALLGSLGPLEHQSFDNWVALLRVNVAAPMGLTRIVMPLLARSPDASVVFTLDSRGQEPRAYWGGYAVTKAAIAALARELADEWENRTNVRVNAIVPGPIRSPLRRQTHPGEDPRDLPDAESLVPLYRHLIAGQRKQDSE